MKTRIFITALFCILAVNVFAQSGWQLLNPLPVSYPLTSVSYVGNNTLYSAGQNGVIKSTNGGDNWIRVQDTGYYLSSFFVNSSTGWVAGNSIKKTTDGGASWTVQLTLGSEYRSKMFFVNENTGWYTGAQVIYKTTNGGASWVQNSGFGAQNLFDVYFTDANTGWIAAGGTGIALTTNGGNNWSVVSLSIDPNCLYFINANTGYTYGYSSTVMKTTNGGISWFTVSTGVHTAFSMKFINENTGWISGYKNWIGQISKTTNGGVNWTPQIFEKAINFSSICFADNNTGWAVGDKGEILKTTNAGVNWIYRSSTIVYDFTSVYFTDANTGYVTGIWDTSGYFRSNIFKTTDGGYSWAPKSSEIPNSMWSIYFSGPNTGWAVGLNSRILKTTNGGENWFYQFPDSSADFNAVYFINTNTGWATGSRVLKTTNGGTNWIWLSNTIGYSLSFADANTGWALDYFAYVNKTTNGGVNWTRYDLPIWFQNYPSALQFINSQTGYVVGGFGNLMFKSTNGGTNWNSISLTINYGNCVYFPDLNTGYVSGEDKIVRTTNQGINWTVFRYPSTNSVYSMYFVNGNTGWAVGRYGLIMKTTTGGVGINPVNAFVPDRYMLYQNYPNPFNSSTRLRFEIPKTGNVRLEIFDVSGRLLDTPVSEYMRSGVYETIFDGSKLASGVYLCRMRAGGFSRTVKMLLVK